MGQVRYLADHNLNERLVDGVLRRDPTIDFVHVRDVGPSDRSDPDVLEWAAAHDYIVVSHDVNTMTGHAYDRMQEAKPMRGLLLVNLFEPLGPVIESLVLIAVAAEAEEWEGRVAYLPI